MPRRCSPSTAYGTVRIPRSTALRTSCWKGGLLLFCDSSFWHGRDWKKLKARLEAGNNPEYWVKHIDDNRKRDRKVNRELRKRGHAVLRFWDTDIRKRPGWCVERIMEALGESGP